MTYGLALLVKKNNRIWVDPEEQCKKNNTIGYQGKLKFIIWMMWSIIFGIFADLGHTKRKAPCASLLFVSQSDTRIWFCLTHIFSFAFALYQVPVFLTTLNIAVGPSCIQHSCLEVTKLCATHLVWILPLQALWWELMQKYVKLLSLSLFWILFLKAIDCINNKYICSLLLGQKVKTFVSKLCKELLKDFFFTKKKKSKAWSKFLQYQPKWRDD